MQQKVSSWSLNKEGESRKMCILVIKIEQIINTLFCFIIYSVWSKYKKQILLEIRVNLTIGSLSKLQADVCRGERIRYEFR